MNIELSSSAKRVLLKIYIGQNIREEGILQSEIGKIAEVQELFSRKLIRRNHWHLDQFLTTKEGSLDAGGIVKEKIEANRTSLLGKIKAAVPDRVIHFIVRRYVLETLAFPAEKEYFDVRTRYPGMWEDAIMADGRIWILWNEFFESLMSFELCVKTLDYVSTRGGETRFYHYVISPEVKKLLVDEFEEPDFPMDEEKSLKLYSFLITAKRIFASDDIDQVRQRYYESLKHSEVTEEQVAGIINEMSKERTTSEYRGLLSEWKPFDITNPTSYLFYLSQNIIEPALKILLKGKGTIKEYHTEEKMPSLPEVKSISGILDEKEIGNFYVMVSSLERQIREFTREKLGKGWEKRIEHDLPKVYEHWVKNNAKDKSWGIDPEKDLMNYADLGDYIAIVRKYSRTFSSSDDNLGDIITQLKIWYNQGRNPIMHSRTVNKQKFYTTKSAIDFLSEWMRNMGISVS
ncbi:hypothetical protein MUP01_06665 [Candidatus Bathyarchaeota archaeon]|jgi:hypothetical protein|nr:hypothetical protein [Candidatus Bathyarchaeota archaeon]